MDCNGFRPSALAPGVAQIWLLCNSTRLAGGDEKSRLLCFEKLCHGKKNVARASQLHRFGSSCCFIDSCS